MLRFCLFMAALCLALVVGGTIFNAIIYFVTKPKRTTFFEFVTREW